MKLKLALASLLLAAGFAAPAIAYPGALNIGYHSWDHLGSRTVRHSAENDTIFAPGRRHYRQIKVCAYHRAVRFYDLDVVFRSGGHQDVSVRRVLAPGECTRAVDLYGHRRDIRFVRLAYETIGRNFGRRAVVSVYAR